MGFFDFLKGPDINQGVQEYGAVPGAVLLDVRTPQEYREGHSPRRGGARPRRERRSPVRILPQRRTQPSGGQPAGPDGLCQRKKYRRNRRIQGKGGVLK